MVQTSVRILQLIDKLDKLNIRNMKSFLIIMFSVCFCSVFAQNNATGIKTDKSNSVKFKETAQKVISVLGPDFLQPDAKYYVSNIKDYVVFDTRMSKNEGRKYRSVRVSYFNREVDKDTIYTTVNIWEDTGEPETVFFPNGMGRIFHDIAPSFSELIKNEKDLKHKEQPRKMDPKRRD